MSMLQDVQMKLAELDIFKDERISGSAIKMDKNGPYILVYLTENMDIPEIFMGVRIKKGIIPDKPGLSGAAIICK